MSTLPTRSHRLPHGLIALLLAAGLLLHAGPGLAWAQDKLQAEAQTITGDSLLIPPDDLETSAEFTIAKTAPQVDLVSIPLPDTPADPWSNWGLGVIHSNGKVYMPMGDHLGVDANSYIYEYDPETKVVRQVADVLSAVEDYEPGDFGYGKIHGRLNEGADGNIYFGTYWGQWKKDNEHYHGDRIFRYNPETEELTDLGMPVFGWGYPSTHMDEQRLLFYAEAHRRKSNSKGNPEHGYIAEGYDSPSDPYDVEFLVYDVEKREVIFQGGHEGLPYGRDFFVDEEGNAYFNNGDGSLQKYVREKNAVEPVEGVKLPADGIRRAVGPDDNGIMYGSTHDDPSELFSFDPESGEVRVITSAWANTAAMDVTPDGKYIYFIPGSHGPLGKGRPLVQVDVSSGEQKVIAFLAEPAWEQAKYHLGGTYDLNVTDDGSTVYVGFNGGEGEKDDWKNLAIVTVHIPESER